MINRSIAVFFIIFLWFESSESRIQSFKFTKDDRSVIQLSSFGYLKDGSLVMNMKGLKTKNEDKVILNKIGFTLDKSNSEGRSSYLEHQDSVKGCILNVNSNTNTKDTKRAVMRFEKLNGKYFLAVYTMGLNGLNITTADGVVIPATKQLLSTANKKNKKQTKGNQKSVGKGQPKGDLKTPDKKVVPTNSAKTNTTTKKPWTKPATAKKQKMPAAEKPLAKKSNATSGKTSPAANKQKNSSVKKQLTSVDESSKSRKRRDVKSDFTLLHYLPVSSHNASGDIIFDLDLQTKIFTDEQEGLYGLFFHNCNGGIGFKSNPTRVSAAMVNITETNKGNFLSAGDIPLPVLYAVMSSLFFFMAFQWISVLCVSTGKVFLIHYMMAVLVIIKGMSLTFHAVDLYFISKDGTPETWAIIFYVVHLLKGVLLFIILLLIGTGWAFIKYVLSDREKKVFMIVIPLQVFANIAYIVIQDTSESSKSYYTWKNVMILVDIFCCVAILCPVVWSVRHLQEASQTDGKAAINLQKLKLFQRFYVMIICYLYFTRLIVYLLEITLPFQLIWIHMLFSELGSLIFFFLTGYQFRPGCDNPYLSVPQEDNDYVESLALTESGLTETVSRVNKYDGRHVEDTTEEDLLLPEWRQTSAKNLKSNSKV